MAARRTQESRPMSPWNKAALVSLKPDLKQSVLMSTGLSDRLQTVAGGFMNAEEERKVKKKGADDDQVEELIAILEKKQDEDFFKFLSMLRVTNQGVWADELERKAKELREETKSSMVQPQLPLTPTIRLTQEGAVDPVDIPTDRPTVFAVVTANPTEESMVRHFLQLQDPGTIWDEAKGCIWKNDSYLKKKGVTVKSEGVLDDKYELFTLTKEGGSEKVIGIHVKCRQQAAFTEGGAQETTADLLMCAKKHSLKLSDLFSVGCCGLADDGKSGGNLMGHVLLAKEVEAYLNRGKMTEDSDIQNHPEVYKTDIEWMSCLQDRCITKPDTDTAVQPGTDSEEFKDIPFKEVPRFEVGPFVVKSAEYADHVRGVSYRAGIEMEAVGFIKELLSRRKQGDKNIPKFTLVKGVSDSGQDKSAGGTTNFFGKTIEKVDDDVRQQVATLHSIALVIRGVVNRYLFPRPATDLKILTRTSEREEPGHLA